VNLLVFNHSLCTIPGVSWPAISSGLGGCHFWLAFNISITFVGEAYNSTMILLEGVLKEYPEHKSSIKWLGKVSYEELNSYYKKADAFVYGSTCKTME